MKDLSRSIDQLIIVAAPSCCGKTRFINRICSNEISNLNFALGIENPNDWVFVNADDLSQLGDARIPKMIFHYALPSIKVSRGQTHCYAQDERLGIMEKAIDIRIVTLHATPSTLVERVQLRKVRWKSDYWQMIRDIFLFKKEFRRLEQLEELYSSPCKVVEVYNQWFNHIKTYPLTSSWLIGVDNKTTIQVQSEWKDIVQNWM